MQGVDRGELKEMMDRGEDIALVEVLSPSQFRKFHLPGAVNVPLDKNFARSIREVVPSRDRTVVVYCSDVHCLASPQAGRLLDEMGYVDVRHYAGGKQEWLESGLPVEGEGREAQPGA